METGAQSLDPSLLHHLQQKRKHKKGSIASVYLYLYIKLYICIYIPIYNMCINILYTPCASHPRVRAHSLPPQSNTFYGCIYCIHSHIYIDINWSISIKIYIARSIIYINVQSHLAHCTHQSKPTVSSLDPRLDHVNRVVEHGRQKTADAAAEESDPRRRVLLLVA